MESKVIEALQRFRDVKRVDDVLLEVRCKRRKHLHVTVEREDIPSVGYLLIDI